MIRTISNREYTIEIPDFPVYHYWAKSRNEAISMAYKKYTAAGYKESYIDFKKRISHAKLKLSGRGDLKEQYIHATETCSGGVEACNCGGFALGLFDWYVPNQNGTLYKKDDNVALDQIEQVIENLDGIRLIKDEEQVHEDEDIVYFKASYCEDSLDMCEFHFMRDFNGELYEKRGELSPGRVETDNFGVPIWDDLFLDCPTYYFAVKKTGAHYKTLKAL